MVDNLCKIEFPSHKDTLRQKFGWNWSSGSGEDDFKISMSMYFCYFIILSPWKKEWPLIWTYLNSLHLRLLCVMFGWNKPSGSGDFLQILSTYFRYYFIISPRKRVGLFLWTNLNSRHIRMLCPKFGWNRYCGSGEEDFLVLFMNFPSFLIISPQKKNPSPKYALCQVWLKLASGSGEKTDKLWSEKLI